jgi:hypothetical protein
VAVSRKPILKTNIFHGKIQNEFCVRRHGTNFLFIPSIVVHQFSLETTFLFSKNKGKIYPITGNQGPRVGALLILDLGASRGGWSAPSPGRFTPGKDPIPIVQEDRCVPGPVWTCVKNANIFQQISSALNRCIYCLP